jgi:hypothetical protein
MLSLLPLDERRVANCLQYSIFFPFFVVGVELLPLFLGSVLQVTTPLSSLMKNVLGHSREKK